MKHPHHEGGCRRMLTALVILGILLRILLCFEHNPLDYLFSDPKRHWLNGVRLLSPDLMGASDPLLYQVYIFILRGCTHDNRDLIALACGLLSAIMPWTFYRAAREFHFTKLEALWVWAIITWLPSLFTIYHYFMMETLLLPLVGLSIWMSGRCLRKGTTEAWISATLCWTLAIMAKPTVVPLSLCCLAFIWVKQSDKARRLVISAFVMLVMLTPNSFRTYHYLGFVAPLGNPWITKIQHRSGARQIEIRYNGGTWRFASPSVAIRPLEPLSPWTMKRALADTTITVSVNSANGARDWQEAYRQLKIGLGPWMGQLGENMLLFLFAPSWPDSNTQEWDGWLNYELRWLWAPLIFYLIECNVRVFAMRQFPLLPVAVTLFVMFLMFQNVATDEGRYRKPLEPLLVLNFIWTLRPMSRKSS